MSIGLNRPRAKKFRPPVDRMKTVAMPRGYNKLKIELPGCTVFIQVGLQNSDWEDATYISIDADGDRYAGGRPWFTHWGKTEFKGGACRVIHEQPGSEFSQRRKYAEIKRGLEASPVL